MRETSATFECAFAYLFDTCRYDNALDSGHAERVRAKAPDLARRFEFDDAKTHEIRETSIWNLRNCVRDDDTLRIWPGNLHATDICDADARLELDDLDRQAVLIETTGGDRGDWLAVELARDDNHIIMRVFVYKQRPCSDPRSL